MQKHSELVPFAHKEENRHPYVSLSNDYQRTNKQRSSSDIIIDIKTAETFFINLSSDLLKEILSFMSINEIARFSTLNHALYKLGNTTYPSLSNIRILYKMEMDLDPKNGTPEVRSYPCCSFVLLFINALLTWGIVELGKHTVESHSYEKFFCGLGIAGLSLIDIFLLCAGCGALCEPIYKTKPSKATGNLEKMITTYNKLFPDHQLGTEGNDDDMSIKGFRDLFRTEIKEIKSNHSFFQSQKRLKIELECADNSEADKAGTEMKV